MIKHLCMLDLILHTYMQNEAHKIQKSLQKNRGNFQAKMDFVNWKLVALCMCTYMYMYAHLESVCSRADLGAGLGPGVLDDSACPLEGSRRLLSDCLHRFIFPAAMHPNTKMKEHCIIHVHTYLSRKSIQHQSI